MSDIPMTDAGQPVIQVACPMCGAQPKQRCKTKSQMESRTFHAARYRVDPPPTDEYTSDPSYMEYVPEVEADSLPPEIDEETEALEREIQASYYQRGLESAILGSSIGRAMSGQAPLTIFKGGNKGKTDRRRAKNRVAKASRKKNRSKK